ncbi:16S rRNA processing protein RimM [[Leptolyngbya] sp. PCC 7376]|uniref:ribosome maturation factor RimM n=1 Tax=[Leptolyngbya] sp. PCC 7376 TaxID=111781 RepID=UPI00029F2AB3|nr:ribosome maturation factor RimM [[Leptolyngbya] sp. PCC 7376]AFY39825.1 16S rRNA processing protein RimM [[Leptolyngbya] sp. PCC 7376]
MTEQEWIVIGKVVAAQGLKGEIRVNPSTDFPERFEVAGQRWLRMPNQSPESVELERGRRVPGKNIFVVKFEHVVDRNHAETLRGAEILVRAGDRPELEEGEYHVSDLIGLNVLDVDTKEKLGIVSDIYSAGQDLLEVTDANKQKHLVPFVKEIVPVVDLVEQQLEVNAPPGLFGEAPQS